MKFALFNKLNEMDCPLNNEIISLCQKSGLVLDYDNPDIVFVVGGDGTFLRAVHQYMDRLEQISFIGVRSGSLGFYYDFAKEELPELVSMLAKKELVKSEHHLIECELNGKIIYAINEIRFENPFHTLVCKVKINGEELETFHGNGLLVCNELGSTAYNKSLSGAVITHDLHLLQLTEISTIQNNAYRSLGSSLILNENTVCSFEGNFHKTVIGYDHLTCDSNQTDVINVYTSKKKVTFLHHPNHSNIETLKRSFVK